MRRTLPPEPWSQAALWSRSVAVFAATVAILAVAAGAAADHCARVRAGRRSAPPWRWRSWRCCSSAPRASSSGGPDGVGRGGRRGALSSRSLTLGYPAYLAFEAMRLPVLSDISTDVANPPYFSLSRAAYEARGGFQPKGADPEAREAQRAAYPDVEPIVVDLDADEAFALVLQDRQGGRLEGGRPAPAGRPHGRGPCGLSRQDADHGPRRRHHGPAEAAAGPDAHRPARRLALRPPRLRRQRTANHRPSPRNCRRSSTPNSASCAPR